MKNRQQLIKDLSFIRNLSEQSPIFREQSSDEALRDVIENLLAPLATTQSIDSAKTLYKYFHAGFQAQYFESEAALLGANLTT
jgi:hypothetical protein